LQKNKMKTAREIAYLKKATSITHEIFRGIARKVKPGVSEEKIKNLIESAIKAKGLKRSFGTIVACGRNAAIPHAKAGGSIIKKNDLVVIDFGVIYKGYHSDMTRTIITGSLDPLMRKLYRTVRSAQSMAIRKMRPGLKISDFVKSIHDYMRKNGFGKYMLHSLGHGLGRKIHEPPKLSEKNNRRLKQNMVLTIEPGLYVKGRGGARIEDAVVLTKKGAKVLT